MENNEIQPKRIAISRPDEQVPATLLANVLSRLEQRQTYMQPNLPSQDILAGLNHPAWEIRAAAIQALDSSITTDMLRCLLPALEDEHRLVRVAALRALSRMKKGAPLEHLLPALRDDDWEVREMAVLCLVEINAQEADLMSSLLRISQHDPHGAVRDAAHYALIKHENDLATISKQSPQETTIQPEIVSILAGLRELTHQTIRVSIHYAVILKRQAALIHKSVWLGSLGIMLLGSILSINGLFGAGNSNLQNAISYLALFMCISAAAGTAFLYGGENDLALELILTTPTSIRVIMLFRFMLVLGYNILLSACASIAIAMLHGGGLWEVIQCWLGPMILISSIAFSISLLLGSWLSLLISLLATTSHLLSLNINQPLPSINLIMTNNWQINPLICCGALLLLLVAISYAPRQPRLSTI
jgi:hypothetical protein